MDKEKLIAEAVRLASKERAARDAADDLLAQRDEAMLRAVEAGASVYSLREPMKFASHKSAYIAVERARRRREAEE
ncbi:hypothetical protein [Actinomyces timonensis]|uniref:hypothetical protein n=1 Tax=Actinomyces timonensis TaxID=1288391 RepID=UPI0002E4BC2C|nr:hypothetical protein [Actinomyces timonensis]